LVEVPQTQPPFIVLENMARDSQQQASRGLHVLSLADKVLKLGRSHESHVRIADVSISRCHAMIRFHRGQFILEDNNSKFGTLVAMKKPRLLESGSTVSIQMGRTVLSLFVHSDPSAANMQPLLPPAGSTVQDERALRHSLLNCGSSRMEPDDAAGEAGPSE
jgi:predicted component of type VI protein secretion system